MRLLGNSNLTILLDSEVHELTIEIDGDTHLIADVSEDDYVCCDGGSSEGDYIWRDNCVYVENEGYYHEDDQGRYFWYHESDGVLHPRARRRHDNAVVPQPTKRGIHQPHQCRHAVHHRL